MTTEQALQKKSLEELFSDHKRYNAFAEVEYDRLNISTGSKMLEEVTLIKKEILNRVDKNDYFILLDLVGRGIITIKEMDELKKVGKKKEDIVFSNLAKLSEECGELTQIAMKSLIHGVNSSNPKTGETNRELLQVEMTDVIASIYHLAKLIDLELPDEMITKRKEKLTRLYG